MPRAARVIVVDVPYHVTQRGNRKQDVFYSDGDYRMYLAWLNDYAERYGLEILAYCLMPNHVHIVAIPRQLNSMANTMRILDKRHSDAINAAFDWTGHLWQSRYFSAALDETHLWNAVRYVERNPVRAGIVEKAEDYPWSSAAFHLGKRPSRIIKSNTEWGGVVEGWAEALASPEAEEMLHQIRSRTHCGFPCGDEEFIARMSDACGQSLVLRRRGRPKKL
jgi:putative transposase